jgi:GNAT superfamily N-acetyltransferase
MKVALPNGEITEVRLLKPTDKENLHRYFQQLSEETLSRFGPHPFDRITTEAIFSNPDSSMHRYIALNESTGEVVAYMLIKQGMIEADQQRYARRNQFFDAATTVTFAPSVADAWQSSGLGSAMASYIEDDLINNGMRVIILWGGVQASNSKAVNFYKKRGYQFIASFWHDDKDNHDMIKEL